MDVQKVSQDVLKKQWKQRIEDRAASGKTITEWCREKDINPSTYYYWLKTIRQDICEVAITKQPIASNSQFVALPKPKNLETTSETNLPSVTIQIGSSTISINNNISPELLSMLVEILKC